MNRRTRERPPAPTDAEILAYDNVPVDVAARYLNWPENTVRLALREGRACFGTSIRDKGITHKISPGGLVKYKRDGAPCMDYETMAFMLEGIVRKVMQEELEQITGNVVRRTIQAEFAQLMENIGQTVGAVVQRVFQIGKAA